MVDEMQYGTSAKTSADSSGIPVLRMGNIKAGGLVLDSLKYLPIDHDEFPALFLRDGDILFNRTNSAELVGKTAVYRGNPSPCSCASYLIRARLKQGYVPEFLAYYINSTFGRAWIRSVVSQQVGQANVNGTKLKALSVPVPNEGEQRRIVAEIEKQFTRLEAGVTALRRVQANLKRYRGAVLKAACEGKLVEGDRTQWQKERLGQLVTIRYGKMLPTKEFSESGFPVFGANGIIGYHTQYLYEAEQVLISCRGAHSGKLNLSPPKCYITNNSLVLEMPERSRVEKRFLFYVLQTADKSRLVTGSAQPQVTINNADVLDVPVPSLAEQTRIVAEVERRLSVVEELEAVVSANLQRATRLRQSILRVAFAPN